MTIKAFYSNVVQVKYIFLITIAITITLPWCWVYGINGLADLQVPIGYSGDGVFSYALIKAFASGEIYPIFFKIVSSLNAPFVANWNDFPFEEFIYFPAGVMAYFFGLSAGVWLYLLGIQLLAGFSFFFAACKLDIDKTASTACAVLFGLAPFEFYRSIPHLTIAMIWHIPLLLISLLWCQDPTKVKLTLRQGLWLGVIAGLLAGLYNPYYWVMFLFLLVIILIGTLYRKDWQHACRLVIIMAAALAGFVISNIDTLLFASLYGKGSAFNRNLWSLVVFGLRLPDLITPVQHRFHAYNALFDTCRTTYPGYLKGEAQSAYIGLIAISGLVILFFMSTVRLAGRAFDRINDLYWLALGIFSFAIVGGINYLLGSFGFVLFRATNRFSIMLMAIGLLVVAQYVSTIKRKWVAYLLAVVILFMGLYDQLPQPPSQATKDANLAIVSEDKAVATALESNMGAGVTVFQLPVKAFPETGSIHNMGDYDLFRPWIWTKNIHFSYGTMKGRGEADWQTQLANKPTDQMLNDLNRYGFSVLLINRSAYKDSANELKNQILSMGYEFFIDQQNYYGFKLKPIANPEFPVIDQYIATFEKGFYGPEMNGSIAFRWANRDALLKITPSWLHVKNTGSVESGKLIVSFDVSTIGERSVWLDVGSSKTLVFSPGDKTKQVKLEIEPDSFPTALHIYSDSPGLLPGNGDSRKLAFQVRNLKITAAE